MSGFLQNLFGAHSAEAAGMPLWLVTFTDLMGLMLAFFVLIYATTSPSGQAWSALTETFRGAPVQGAAVTGGSSAASAQGAAETGALKGRLEPAYLSAVLSQHGIATRDGGAGSVRQVLDLEGGRLVLFADPRQLFSVGGDRLSPEGARFMRRLAAVLHYASNPITIDLRAAQTRDGGTARLWEEAFAQAGILRDALRTDGYSGDIAVSAEVAGSGARLALVIAGKEEAQK